AYSNRAGNERAIILYNNSLRSTSGWFRISTPINMGSQDETDLQSRSLVQVLDLRTESNVYYLLRDHRDSLQYIRSGRQLADEGLFVQLPGYQYQAFIDLEEILDSDGTWGQLAA
ncbi:MAG: alpha-amylase, partial [Candidatus Omnitrophica bacterium]|nr:alpha-amylase [Candidatus Omnitrophota bacterium]